MVNVSLVATPTPPVCPQGQFQCGSDNQCIDEQKVCDKHSDCTNDADEPKSCSMSSTFIQLKYVQV